MGFDPVSMAVTAVAKGVTGAFGAIQEGDSAAKAANYNATLAGFNAQQAQRNAYMVDMAGSAKAAMQGRETRAEVGSEKAGAAGRGVGVNSGSAVDVRESTSELGHLDALNIRTNAAKEAYGYQVQSTNFTNEEALDRYSGKAAKSASYVKAASSLLNAGSEGASQFNAYKANKGLGSSHPNTDYGMDEL